MDRDPLYSKERAVRILLECILVYEYILVHSCVITGRNEVVAKVMFLHVSVILYTGGEGVSGEPPPPRDQADTTPPGPRRTPPPPGRRLQHTVNERPLRILLECILVLFDFFT